MHFGVSHSAGHHSILRHILTSQRKYLHAGTINFESNQLFGKEGEPLIQSANEFITPFPRPLFALRPYQEACIASCMNSIGNGITRIGVSSPTGSGKTTIFCSLIARLQSSPIRPLARQALILVGSIELARQAAAQVRLLHPELTVEVEQGQKHVATGFADVTVATYQTLAQGNRLNKFDPSRLKAIIVDEAHHATAPSYLRILSYFNSDIASTNHKGRRDTVPIVGFSATFSRHDGLALGKVFQEIVYHQDFLEMISDKWLSKLEFTSVSAKIDLSSVTINTRSGDFTPSSLAQVVNTDTVNRLVLKTWINRAADRKSTLIFCVNIAHVHDLTAVFRVSGIDARYISGKTPVLERKELLESFRRGDYPVLINCAILTEGADVPNIDCVMLARPTRSKNVFAQMIGRGMRLSPGTGKTECRVIDFVDSLARVDNVVSGPTLFGLDAEVLTEDELDANRLKPEPTDSMTEKSQSSSSRSAIEVPEPESVTYIEHEDPFSTVEGASGSPHVTTLSQHAWVACGNDTYILDCLGQGFIKVQIGTDPAIYEGTFTPTASKSEGQGTSGSPFLRKRKILMSDSLSNALKGCDLYATHQVVRGILGRGLLRSARWRKLPASDAQKRFVEKRWKERSSMGAQKFGDVTEAVSPPVSPFAELTKGEAANIINRLKHGAKANYDKKLQRISRDQERREKDRRRREGLIIKVGPLPQTG